MTEQITKQQQKEAVKVRKEVDCSEESIIYQLSEIFPRISHSKIEYTFENCGKDSTLAFNELASFAASNEFLEEDGEDSTNSETFLKLKSIFPSISKQKICEVLEESDNDLTKSAELLICYLQLQDSQNSDKEKTKQELNNPTSFQYKVKKLKELFPKLQHKIILKALNDCSEDLEKATEDLLTQKLLKDIEAELGEVSVSDLSTLNSSSSLSSPLSSSSSSFWLSSNSDIEKIVLTTGIDEKAARQFYHKNTANVYKSIIDIIYHYAEEKSTAKVNKVDVVDLPEKFIPAGSRVQSAPYNNNRSVEGFKLTIQERDNLLRRKRSFTCNEKEFRFSEEDPAYLELLFFVSTTSALNAINPEFYKSCFIFFSGDNSKIIDLSLNLIDKHLERLTYLDSWSNPRKLEVSKINNNNDINTFSKVVRKTKKVSNGYSGDVVSLERSEVLMQEKQISNSIENHVADLHGFRVKNAQTTTIKVTERWWNDELKAREISGNARYGEKAREIGALKIITGKGVHSVGGISKVRATVKKILQERQFIFIEDQSFFTIYGRRNYKQL